MMPEEKFKHDTTRYRAWYQGCGGKVHHGETIRTEDTLAGLEATGAWVAEPKRDGIWAVTFFDETGARFFSRTQEPKAYSLTGLNCPSLYGCALVGELGYGSQESLRRRRQLGRDFMDVFDIIYQWYTPVHQEPSETRRSRLLGLLQLTDDNAIKDHLLLVPRWTEGFAQRYADEPEGLILKPAQGFPYEGGGVKVKHWLKAKKDHTVDMVIMGYEESTAETKAGKHMVEHLICGMYVNGELKELTKTGGMTHELQQDIVANWEKYKGRVVELKHFGQFKSGALRHPSVVRIREDKRPEDCVFNPDEVSAKHFKSL